MSITVQNVTKIYGEQKALDQVSFEIQPGEIVGFLGPNGAGKSTMMKIITCFIPSTEGQVTVNGHNVDANAMLVKKSVGYLPEHNPLYLEMYVKEYLNFVAGIHKLKNKKQKVAEIIQKVGLELEQKKKIGALSKGYRQRVGLAQAMIHDPDVLILDEPTSGLDPNQLVEIRNLIKTIGQEKTVMMSTHIMQEVEAICDRVIIINRGKIVANESAENLKHLKGKQSVLVEFGGAINKNELKKINGVSRVTAVEANQYRLESNQEADIRASISKFAAQKDIPVLTLQKEEQKLEDIFKELTSS